MRLHHVGYAVSDIRRYVDDFFRPLFAPESVSEPVADPLQHVRVSFARLQGGALIEFVEPLDEVSPLRSIIGSQRGGVYHLCFEVKNIDESIRVMRQRRCLPVVAPVPAVAFGGRRIAFLLTPQRDLIELLEQHSTDQLVPHANAGS